MVTRQSPVPDAAAPPPSGGLTDWSPSPSPARPLVPCPELLAVAPLPPLPNPRTEAPGQHALSFRVVAV